MTEETENLRLMLLDTYFPFEDDRSSTDSEISDHLEIESSKEENFEPLAIENPEPEPDLIRDDSIQLIAKRTSEALSKKSNRKSIEDFIDQEFEIDTAVDQSIATSADFEEKDPEIQNLRSKDLDAQEKSSEPLALPAPMINNENIQNNQSQSFEIDQEDIEAFSYSHSNYRPETPPAEVINYEINKQPMRRVTSKT